MKRTPIDELYLLRFIGSEKGLDGLLLHRLNEVEVARCKNNIQLPDGGEKVADGGESVKR